MYPTLFHIFGLRIDSYSVMWFIGLSLAIIWVIKRLELYGLDEYESRKIMAVSFFCMMIGAIVFKNFRRLPRVFSDPSYILTVRNWGVSEFGAVLGAFLSAFVMCMFSRKVSFAKLCDAATPPAFLAIAIGRWGCFLNGCCVGLPTKFFTGIHFPFDKPGLFRHPVQIYYSVISLVIIGILLYVERRVIPRQQKKYYSVIAPLGIILYALMRFAIVPVRGRHSLLFMIPRWQYYTTYTILAGAFPFLCVWILHSLYKLKSHSQDK